MSAQIIVEATCDRCGRTGKRINPPIPAVPIFPTDAEVPLPEGWQRETHSDKRYVLCPDCELGLKTFFTGGNFTPVEARPYPPRDTEDARYNGPTYAA